MVKCIERITDFRAMDGFDVRYPYVEAEGGNKAGFVKNDLASHKWFSENRDESSGRERMLPLPGILSTSPDLPIFVAKQQNGNNFTGNNHRENRNAFVKTTNTSRYEGGKVYTGVITGHNKTGKFASVELDQGGTASYHDGGKDAENTRVKLMYKGKNAQGYDEWLKK